MQEKAELLEKIRVLETEMEEHKQRNHEMHVTAIQEEHEKVI